MSVLRGHLARLAAGQTLLRDEAREAFGALLGGEASEAETAALLTALRVRGETAEELSGGLDAMRAAMRTISAPEHAIDCCGTGGTGLHTRNVSTAAALVLAGLGVPVAKHGSRAATSLSGSSDVLSALGVGMAPPERAEAVLEEAGLTFLFAPHFHPGVGHVAGVRRALPFRTAFNMLGPLSNPARVRRQVLGVAAPEQLTLMAATLDAGGTEHAWVVRGQDGLDELSVCAPSEVVVVREGRFARREVTAEAAGLAQHPFGALRGGDPKDNAGALRRLLGGESGAYRDAVCLNAAAGLIVAGRTEDLAEGARLAGAALDDGRAGAALERLKAATA